MRGCCLHFQLLASGMSNQRMDESSVALRGTTPILCHVVTAANKRGKRDNEGRGG